MMKVRKPITPEQAMVRMEELCARAEHSSGEIMQKLLRLGIFPSDAERIVRSMTQRRFIDDSRFARAFARDKMEYARWGKRKIALALYQKRVSRELIAEALDSLDTERYRLILHELIAAKKRNLAEPDTYEGRTKLFRFAASRGFEPDLIASALRSRQ